MHNQFDSYRTAAIVSEPRKEKELSFGLKVLRFFVPYGFWQTVHVEFKAFKTSNVSYDAEHLIMYLEKKPLLFSSLLPAKKRVIVSDDYRSRYDIVFFDLKNGKKLLKEKSQHFWDLWRYWEKKQDLLKVIEHGTEIKS